MAKYFCEVLRKFLCGFEEVKYADLCGFEEEKILKGVVSLGFDGL